MTWTATAISPLSSDTEPSLVFAFADAKYLFNVGENTTRSFIQTGRRWNRTKAIFTTDVGVRRTGGLPGLLMSFGDANIKDLTVVGPTGLMHYLASCRFFTYREGIYVNPVEVPLSGTETVPSDAPVPVYKDENILVYAFPVPSEDAAADNPGEEASYSHSLKRKRSPSPPSTSKNGARPSSPETSASLETRMMEHNFHPTPLTGQDADDWRRMAIQRMFPAEKPVEEPKTTAFTKRQNKKQAKQAAKEASASPKAEAPPVAPVRTNMARPPGHDRQLPGFCGGSKRPVLAYVIAAKPVRGKFDAAAAIALGLPRGPIRAQLSRGEAVTFQVKGEDGAMVDRTVKPEQVMGKPDIPSAAIVLDIPDQSYLPGLISTFKESAWLQTLQFQDDDEARKLNVHSVFHFCGDGVLNDERYSAFMNFLGTRTTHHVVASREHLPDPVSFTTAAYNTLRLNRLDPAMFPLPKYTTEPMSSLNTVPGLPANCRPLRPCEDICMRPPRDPVDGLCDEDLFYPALTAPDELLPAELAEAFDKARKAVELDPRHGRSPAPGDDVLVVSLGTASSAPSRSRNVSGTLVRIPGHGSLLLDAGEATWGQLARQFGVDPAQPGNVWEVLRDLKCIFISHVHADHHLGVAKILSMRRKLNPPPAEPLYLVGNWPTVLYLQEQSDIEDLGISDPSGNGVLPILGEWITCLHEKWSVPLPKEAFAHQEPSRRMLADLEHALGLKSLQTVTVKHPGRCFGVVLKHNDDWSFVYSGDTAPCEELVQAGRDATLLIHEATMADEEAALAKKKRHSTFGQALDIANRMNAKHIIFTHFSLRYPKMPGRSFESSQRPLALAFDGSSIRVGDIWKFETYLPAIEKHYADTEVHDAQEQVVAADMEVDVTANS